MVYVKRERSRTGAAVVEAALVLPLLLLLIFGVIEYGWVLLRTQQITNATRQAARVGARPDATNAEVADTAANLLAAVGIQGYELTMPTEVGDVLPGEQLTVKLSVPYANIKLAGPGIVPMPASFSASVTMAKEGP